ncbi:MAG: CoA ester lyase, partial [Pseudomonadota bacterium]
AKRSATLGCVGKWAIHPKQVALANEVFTPPADKVEHARRILKAMAEAEASGQGAAVLDGKLIDLASSRQAQVIVRQAELIETAG